LAAAVAVVAAVPVMSEEMPFMAEAAVAAAEAIVSETRLLVEHRFLAVMAATAGSMVQAELPELSRVVAAADANRPEIPVPAPMANVS
jgi:hypothetical protein